MELSRPLDSFPLIETRNLDQMRASLARIYVEPVIELVGRGRTLRVVINHCQLRHIGLNYACYGAEVHFRYPASNYVGQVFPLAGNADVFTDDVSVAIDPGRSVLFSATSAFTMTSTAAYERLFLTLDPAALADKLGAMTGVAIRSPLKLQPAQDLTQPLARVLRQNLVFLVDRLSATELLPSLVLAEFEQTLMVMFLHANRHNYSHLLKKRLRDSAPGRFAGRRNTSKRTGRAITLEDLAEVAGSSALACFGFRKSRGYSPEEFLTGCGWTMPAGCCGVPTRRHGRDRCRGCGFADLGRFERISKDVRRAAIRTARAQPGRRSDAALNFDRESNGKPPGRCAGRFRRRG